ncbi:hypothetical protein BCR39DRAFT_542990 [Naematelia encephala]|uniref:Uncharacterized protein n=1 Tax=Naematelia encephala TaxID=71784 RepID=A0A1Y2ATQ0_9TREE|nr:hypothetical protein BCR39DRAFT_542990 [Naematelia encephala]
MSMSRISIAAINRLAGPSTRPYLSSSRLVVAHSCRSTPFHRSFSASQLRPQSQLPPPPPSPPPLGAPGESKGRFSVVQIVSAIVVVSLFATIYGVLEYYNTLSDWPEPIRSSLRSALKASARNDPARADHYYRQAIQAALTLPCSTLEPDPLRKLSGIFISHAGMLEKDGQLPKAFEQLRTALELFGPHALDKDASARISGDWAGNIQISDGDHIRAIGLAQKLGDLALRISNKSIISPFPHSTPTPTSTPASIPAPLSASAPTPLSTTAKNRKVEEQVGPRSWPEAAEHYFSTALSAMLRIGLASRSPESTDQVIIGRDLELADGNGTDTDADGSGSGKITKRTVALTMMGLSDVYASKGEYALAGQLLIQAVSTLLPPTAPSEDVLPVADRCQAAVLMTSISSLALKPNTTQAKKTSKSWSLRSLQLANKTISSQSQSSSNNNSVSNSISTSKDPSIAICQQARITSLFNLGMLAEMDNDLSEALRLLSIVSTSAKELGFVEGRRQALDALRRIGKKLDSSSST